MFRWGYSLCILAGWLLAGGARAGDAPAWLPRYDLDIQLSCGEGRAEVRQRVTWTNRHQRPTREIVFNAHSHYAIPDSDVGLLAKTLELLRLAPSDSMSFAGPPLEVQSVHHVQPGQRSEIHSEVAFGYRADNATALVVSLPHEVGPGESVTLELRCTVKLPKKQGRWGQWNGITTLVQWLPVAAVYDENGWHPVPFIPWHQPFFNEAGRYTATITLEADQKLACSAPFLSCEDLGDGRKKIVTVPVTVRDFSMVASSRFEEFQGKADGVTVRCLALPEHAKYAQLSVQSACDALPIYNSWFGRYPYSQFTLVEAFFGWNGNECGAMVMIDYRMFNMPQIATAYVDYLICHELCHQWWYNVVGTNGYAETFMDEGLATYFSHRLYDRKVGRNNKILKWPEGFDWLPNIHREDFRNYGFLGVRKRGSAGPTVQEMEKFDHLANLMGMTYDRGSKIIGLIEERLGEAAFLDFIRHVFAKYQFQILRVADFQRELEGFTGKSWEEFFQHYLYKCGMCDWDVHSVEYQGRHSLVRKKKAGEPVEVTIRLRRHGDFDEPAVLGIRLQGEGREGYQIRLPLHPDVEEQEFPEYGATIKNYYKATERGHLHRRRQVPERWTEVRIALSSPPSQVSVDPDRVLLDENPTNNHWKPEIRWRPTPVYTQLEEADVSNAYDRWNVIFGPWLAATAYMDPWYGKSPIAGFKLGAYRTQEFSGGGFVGFRANDRNFVVGFEALWDHVPFDKTQVGIHVERSLGTFGNDEVPNSRGVLYGRYIMTYGSSLYLPPFEYVEGFMAVQHRILPDPDVPIPGTNPYYDRTSFGLHYHKYYLTPYWDPEGGVALDATFQSGVAVFGTRTCFQQVLGQISTVKYLPSWFTGLSDGPIMQYLKETRFAFRLGGAAATPDDGLFFTLGGGDHYRGFDLSRRQGNLVWFGSVEWRIPIARHLEWDCFDNLLGVRNIYLAPFYDVGDAYVNNESYGPVAHAFGLGLRIDLSWLGLIERTMFRFDVAQTINVDSPTQFWLGFQHPF